MGWFSASSGWVRLMLVLIRYGCSPGRFCIQTGPALFRTTRRQMHWQSASTASASALSKSQPQIHTTSDSRALTSCEKFWFWFWFTEAKLTQSPIIPQENRKWQTEMENKRRQLEDERRALQHLKSKVLRERWLLEGPAGPDQNQDPDQVQSQLEEDEARTRTLEESIRRLEQEVSSLETGLVSQTITHSVVMSTPDPAVEVKGHSRMEQGGAKPSGQVIQEVKVQKSVKVSKPREARGEMKKVVHEMNGDDAHLLSSVEVEELIHKADEASVMSHSVTTATSLPTGEVLRESGLPAEPEPGSTWTPSHALAATTEITGLEAVAGGEPEVAEASAENPVTMVFMGYQEVEDEDQTRKVLGLQGTVKAELVLIDDGDGKVDPPASAAPPSAAPSSAAPPTPTKAPETVMASNGEAAVEGRAVAGKKKQPCKCCSIM
ncbi:paralemmin 1a isoform X4 [Poecilia formosa]|uniref:paralemmin 1a isoform X4 n=1 Tax=Poecilia formosa TaxID=48698 RepID=UPI0007B7EA49|nr:PREDICTED: paralemmin-1 isoform X4 [Poecilia formosa]